MVPSENLQDGTIEFVTRRLERWGRNAPRGLALVTFDSEFARRQVVDRLKEAFSQAGIPFHEIALPVRQPIVQVIDELVKQLVALEPGIVSISGFATASEPEKPLGEVVRIFNFNRENLAQSHLRSIWWVTREFSTRLLVDAPDLHSWFLVRLELTEQVVDLTPEKPLFLSGEHSPVPVEQARRHSAYLAERFETALRQHAPLVDLTQLAVDSIKALLSAGLEQEAKKLSQRFTEKLTSQANLLVDKVPENNQQVVIALTNLAKLFKIQGLYSQAENLYKKVLDLIEEAGTFKLTDKAEVLNGLAGVYKVEGNFQESERLYKEALEIRKTYFGSDTLPVAHTLNNMVWLFNLQGNYKEAEASGKRALAIRLNPNNGLNSDDELIARTLHNLADAYYGQGRYDEAQDLYQKALAIFEKKLGKESVPSGGVWSKLARLSRKQNRLIEAEAQYQKAYTILTSKLGKDHPDTKTVKENYLSLLRQMGRTAELD